MHGGVYIMLAQWNVCMVVYISINFMTSLPGLTQCQLFALHLCMKYSYSIEVASRDVPQVVVRVVTVHVEG